MSKNIKTTEKRGNTRSSLSSCRIERRDSARVDNRGESSGSRGVDSTACRSSVAGRMTNQATIKGESKNVDDATFDKLLKRRLSAHESTWKHLSKR